MEAFSNQDLPFEQVVAAAQPGRDVDHSPLFQMMFVYQEDPFREVRTPGDLDGLDGAAEGPRERAGHHVLEPLLEAVQGTHVATSLAA